MAGMSLEWAQLYRTSNVYIKQLALVLLLVGVFTLVYWIILCPIVVSHLYLDQARSPSWPYYWVPVFYTVAFVVWAVVIALVLLAWLLIRHRYMQRVLDGERAALQEGITKTPLTLSYSVKKRLGIEDEELRDTLRKTVEDSYEKITVEAETEAEAEASSQRGSGSLFSFSRLSSKKKKGSSPEVSTKEITVLPKFSPEEKTKVMNMVSLDSEEPRGPFNDFLHLVTIEAPHEDRSGSPLSPTSPRPIVPQSPEYLVILADPDFHSTLTLSSSDNSPVTSPKSPREVFFNDLITAADQAETTRKLLNRASCFEFATGTTKPALERRLSHLGPTDGGGLKDRTRITLLGEGDDTGTDTEYEEVDDGTEGSPQGDTEGSQEALDSGQESAEGKETSQNPRAPPERMVDTGESDILREATEGSQGALECELEKGEDKDSNKNPGGKNQGMSEKVVDIVENDILRYDTETSEGASESGQEADKEEETNKNPGGMNQGVSDKEVDTRESEMLRDDTEDSQESSKSGQETEDEEETNKNRGGKSQGVSDKEVDTRESDILREDPEDSQEGSESEQETEDDEEDTSKYPGGNPGLKGEGEGSEDASEGEESGHETAEPSESPRGESQAGEGGKGGRPVFLGEVGRRESERSEVFVALSAEGRVISPPVRLGQFQVLTEQDTPQLHDKT